ncbi:carbon-nitrogen hydrolase family protein [Desulfosporosinus sp. BICA1-9]|uniref:carbon-nitrogen hydrolase family protein n=1 Tax=Desulfosporosinus sp. BICA1-9 TaxID=1531958 RepID=UPI00054BDDDE|nr:carbon-nitrogen hydrolase family protein [Desulfosporosinus sp. BICA1-9]KJS47414.1 MAG: hypothetical protein VR66_19770 [Peptococcaceae bacterium BRH_c23]KJS88328.1 MAG: hypothetical protein JL57_12105 [Desulfosporosinus sp. BICA1-9]HBW38039.1 carbon-nitrogen hydrolase family protein [Desulfosporosinus sp.]
MALKIAAIQMRGVITLNDTLRRMEQLVQSAAEQEVQIACFPELALSGYFPRSKPDTGYRKYFLEDNDEFLQSISAMALSYKMALIIPYAEREESNYYNTALVVDKDGKMIGKYRKMHLPLDQPDVMGRVRNYERRYFSLGNLGFPVFETEGLKFGIQICFDRHFPEGFRCLALAGAQVVFLPTNSPSYGRRDRLQQWRQLLAVRAYENGIYLIAAAKAGVEENISYLGGSAVISPRGEILAEAQGEDDELVVASIDLTKLDEARTDLPYHLARRPGMYNILLERTLKKRV